MNNQNSETGAEKKVSTFQDIKTKFNKFIKLESPVKLWVQILMFAIVAMLAIQAFSTIDTRLKCQRGTEKEETRLNWFQNEKTGNKICIIDKIQ